MTNEQPDKTLDTRGQVCPFPWVRAAKALKKLGQGQVLCVVGDHGPALKNIPVNFADAGESVLSAELTDGFEWRILVRKES